MSLAENGISIHPGWLGKSTDKEVPRPLSENVIIYPKLLGVADVDTQTGKLIFRFQLDNITNQRLLQVDNNAPPVTAVENRARVISELITDRSQVLRFVAFPQNALHPSPEQWQHAQLTEQELINLQLIAMGKSVAERARYFDQTIEGMYEITRLLTDKLGALSTNKAIAKGVSLGYIEGSEHQVITKNGTVKVQVVSDSVSEDKQFTLPEHLRENTDEKVHDILTDREYEFAIHAADSSRTIREIAQELGVSPQTVKNTLGRAYTKLGIESSRKALRFLVANNQAEIGVANK